MKTEQIIKDADRTDKVQRMEDINRVNNPGTDSRQATEDKRRKQNR